MKRLRLALAAAILLWSASALGYSGSGAIWGMKAGEFGSTNKPGTAAGILLMDSYITPTGFAWLGPGTEGLTIPAYRPGVAWFWYRYDGFRIYGTPFEAWPGGVRTFRADSTGVQITGKATVSDSLGVVGRAVVGDTLRVAGQTDLNASLDVLHKAVVGDSLRAPRALFSDSLRTPQATTTNAYVGTSLYLRSAVPGGNGATDPAIYSEKSVSLSSATSAQATKSVDILSRFPDSTAFTNLSLNGLHAINQYGASGLGGGDFATGIAIGGYSEGRGHSAITGSMYGGEFASTMYNYGSAANLFGTLNTAQITSGSVSTVTNLRGSQALARIGGTGNGTVTLALAVEGVAGMQNTASGTITDAIGGRFSTTKDGGVTGTITNATALYVTSPTQGGTNNFGVRIAGTPSGGSNINQALRVDSGPSFFGGTVTVGSSGNAITAVYSSSATLNFDLTSVTVEDLTMTVSGAATGDPVFLSVPTGSVTTTVQYTAWVSAANTVTVRATTQATGENPASGSFRATVFHF